MMVSGECHIKIVKLLLDVGADPNKVANDGSTSLAHAEEQYNYDIVELLKSYI